MIDIAKQSAIEQTKLEVSSRINAKYPLWKQLNYTLQVEANGYDNADNINEMKTYIQNLLLRSKEIQDEINACSTIEEIENIDKTL